MQILLVDEIEPVLQGIPGCEGRLLQAGPSVTQSRLAGTSLDRIGFASVHLGYPTMARIDVGSDVVVAVLTRMAGPGDTQDGHLVRTGDLYVGLPGSRHVSRSREGLEVGIFSIDTETLGESVDALGRRMPWTPTSIVAGPGAAAWHHAYDAIMRGHRQNVSALSTSLLDLFARTTSAWPERERDPLRSWTTDRRIVALVEDYLRGEGRWRATMLELCLVTGFSDRRIEQSFEHIYDTTPHEWMRQRALSAVRRMLTSRSSDETVTRIAADHGFDHLGRFSQYYHAAFGELPSNTAVALRVRERGGVGGIPADEPMLAEAPEVAQLGTAVAGRGLERRRLRAAV